MPRHLKRGILGASTIILSFMCGSNFYETDVNFLQIDQKINGMGNNCKTL